MTPTYTPTVTEVDGLTVVDWPEGEHPTAYITRDLFLGMVEQINALQRVRALHTDVYVISGKSYQHTAVVASCDEFPSCDGTAEEPCDRDGEHELPACVECRGYTDDGAEGFALWPCKTRQIVDRTAQP